VGKTWQLRILSLLTWLGPGLTKRKGIPTTSFPYSFSFIVNSRVEREGERRRRRRRS
jgi:hypothetical protein